MCRVQSLGPMFLHSIEVLDLDTVTFFLFVPIQTVLIWVFHCLFPTCLQDDIHMNNTFFHVPHFHRTQPTSSGILPILAIPRRFRLLNSPSNFASMSGLFQQLRSKSFRVKCRIVCLRNTHHANDPVERRVFVSSPRGRPVEFEKISYVIRALCSWIGGEHE